MGCGLILLRVHYQNFKTNSQDYSKDVEEGKGRLGEITVSLQLETTFYQLKLHNWDQFGFLNSSKSQVSKDLCFEKHFRTKHRASQGLTLTLSHLSVEALRRHLLLQRERENRLCFGESRSPRL